MTPLEAQKRGLSPGAEQGPSTKRERIDQRDSNIREWNASTPNFTMPNGVDSVSATPFDLNATFYPGGGHQYGTAHPSAYGPETMTDQLFGGNNTDWSSGQNEMWYLPPGPGFYQNAGDQAITQTADGVNVGGMDLLDYMTLDPFQDSTHF